MTSIKPIRQEICEKAAQLVGGERGETHGDAVQNMECQGELLEIYEKFRERSTAYHGRGHQVAVEFIIAKLARIACGTTFHRDHYVDIAGYAGIAAECGELWHSDPKRTPPTA